MVSFGILGSPLSHSLSPQLHQLIYGHTGFAGAYNLFSVQPAKLGEAIAGLRVLGVRGVNVTIPYKQQIIPYLDELSPEAERIGAVNTVSFAPDGKTTGYNTDYYGFLMQLSRDGVEVKGKRFLLCGMSGAAHAIRQALEDNGASQVLVASTDPEKGMAYHSLAQLPDMDVIVNCTPLGMYPNVDASVVGVDVLGKFHTAVDIVYNPGNTKFLQLAAGLGMTTSKGLQMLVYQGMKAFTIWTGIQPEDTVGDAIFQELTDILENRK